MNRLGLAADLPPSISQSVSSRSFDASMAQAFAAQRRETSRLASFVAMPQKQPRYAASRRDPSTELR
jgi:hypothetical protein